MRSKRLKLCQIFDFAAAARPEVRLFPREEGLQTIFGALSITSTFREGRQQDLDKLSCIFSKNQARFQQLSIFPNFTKTWGSQHTDNCTVWPIIHTLQEFSIFPWISRKSKQRFSNIPAVQQTKEWTVRMESQICSQLHALTNNAQFQYGFSLLLPQVRSLRFMWDGQLQLRIVRQERQWFRSLRCRKF